MTDRYEAQVSLTQEMVLKDANGDPMPMVGTGDSGHVRPISGTGETSKNRYRPAVGNLVGDIPGTNTITWTEGENVTEINISVSAASSAVSANDDGVRVVFDSIDDASAKLLIADAGGAAVDVQTFWIPNNTTKTFTGKSYFSRVDFLSVSDDMRVTVEAQ